MAISVQHQRLLPRRDCRASLAMTGKGRDDGGQKGNRRAPGVPVCVGWLEERRGPGQITAAGQAATPTAAWVFMKRRACSTTSSMCSWESFQG